MNFTVQVHVNVLNFLESLNIRVDTHSVAPKQIVRVQARG